MSGSGNASGVNIGTFTAPAGDRTINFNAGIVAGTGDGTPPEVTLLGGALGTVSVGPLDPSGTFYPVTISAMAFGSTNVIQIAGDNIDDCYLTAVIQPQNIEDFTVDPTTITFSP